MKCLFRPFPLLCLFYSFLCGCQEYIYTVQTDGHLDGSANEELTEISNQIWLAPNFAEETLGVFNIITSEKSGEFLTVCTLLDKKKSESENFCFKTSIKAQRIDGKLFASIKFVNSTFNLYYLDINADKSSLVFSGILPFLARTTKDEVVTLIESESGEKYAFGNPLPLKLSDLKVSDKLRSAINDLRGVPKNEYDLNEWMKEVFAELTVAEPKLFEVVDKVLSRDKKKGIKIEGLPARFRKSPDHDPKLANRTVKALNQSSVLYNADIVKDRWAKFYSWQMTDSNRIQQLTRAISIDKLLGEFFDEHSPDDFNRCRYTEKEHEEIYLKFETLGKVKVRIVGGKFDSKTTVEHTVNSLDRNLCKARLGFDYFANNRAIKNAEPDIKDYRIFFAGKKIFLAEEYQGNFFFSRLELKKGGGYTIYPLSQSLRAKDYDTESMDASEVHKFLVTNQVNRSFFDEKYPSEVDSL